MTRNPYGWDYPPCAEHDKRAPWNQPADPDPRVADTQDVIDLWDRAADLAGDVLWLTSQFDEDVPGLDDIIKKADAVAAFLLELAKELGYVPEK